MNIIQAVTGTFCEHEFNHPEAPPCGNPAIVGDMDVDSGDVSQPRWFCEQHRPDKQDDTEGVQV